MSIIPKGENKNFIAEEILLFAGCVISDIYSRNINSTVNIPIDTISKILNKFRNSSFSPASVSRAKAITLKTIKRIIK